MSTRDHGSAEPFLGPEIARRVVVGERAIGAAVEPLAQAERACIRGATPARAREFAAGRALARELLGRLGAGSAIIGRAPDRSPVWPAGFVGSIAHTESLCFVAVARRADIASIGVDVEPAIALEAELLETIATPLEARGIRALARAEQPLALRRLFVAKEATYKCLYPLFGRFLEFHDVEIAFEAGVRRFSARAHGIGRLDTELEGFARENGGTLQAFAFVREESGALSP